MYRRDLICQMCELIKENSLVCAVNLVTNGILLTKKELCNLKKTGIYMIQVSLDGFTDESYNSVRQSNDKLSKVLEGITNAKEAGLKEWLLLLKKKLSSLY